MSKILFISTRYPFPIFGGDKLRAFGILKFLSRKNQVDLVCLGKRNEMQKNLAFCKNIKVFYLRVKKKLKDLFVNWSMKQLFMSPNQDIITQYEYC